MSNEHLLFTMNGRQKTEQYMTFVCLSVTFKKHFLIMVHRTHWTYCWQSSSATATG